MNPLVSERNFTPKVTGDKSSSQGVPGTTELPQTEVAVIELDVEFKLHCSDETTVAATRLMFTLCDAPPYDAVTEPLWFAVRLPVLIANVPVVALAAIVTDAGTVSPGRPVLLRLTTAPPDPAACNSVTVQLPLAFPPNVVGLHCSEETTVGATRLIFTLSDVLPYDAVTEPLWFAVRLPVLIANNPVVAFAAIVTDTGTVSPETPVLLRLTTAPPDPAACASVTVQLPLAFAPNVVGLHCSEETTVAATRLMLTLCDAPPYDAVTEPL
jgi:hypothetical protein